jgi:hypothetical protein
MERTEQEIILFDTLTPLISGGGAKNLFGYLRMEEPR